MKQTPWEIAVDWYDEAGIVRAIERAGSGDFGAWGAIPADVKSREFATWLTHQYRLAMSKGIQLGQSGNECLVSPVHWSPGETAVLNEAERGRP